MQGKIATRTLANGLRIVCAPSPTDVTYCGLCVDAGTRDEMPGEEGIAHFTEHLSFKGTRTRRAWHIIRRMESVGGDLNAFTGKEETVYYSTFLRQHFGRAIDLLFDIVFDSTFPQHEMDKEVEVVCDEIESYNDSPAELIFDEFENIVFQGRSLGHSILGQADGLRRMKSADIRRFVSRLYLPQRMALFVLGNVPMTRIVREVEKALTKYPVAVVAQKTPIPTDEMPVLCARENDKTSASITVTGEAETACPQGKTIVVRKQTNQAHVMMGCESFGVQDPRHLHLYFLNNMLGGPGMSSRFNLALRERNGLVYTVESCSTSYTDTGVWSVYFGCDPHDVDRCRKLVRRELEKLTSAPLSPAVLAAAKRQIIGQIGISYDSFENVAIGMGKRLLHYNETLTHEQLVARIEALTAEELHATAVQLFRPERLTTLIFQPED